MDEPKPPQPGPNMTPPLEASPRPESSSSTVQGAPVLKLKAYEGPLDLLLDLIRKQKINIYDIPIAQVTGQYLAYLHMLEEMNIDVAGEFIFMAATLIYIKSRMLLPPDPTAPPEEQEDPRTELVHRLIEHEQFKSAAQMLQSKRVIEEATWSQPGIGEFLEAEDEPGLAVSVFDLIAAFREIIERAKQRPALRVERDQVTVASMVEYIREVLLANSHPVRLDDLIAGHTARQAIIAMVLALLEMVRIHAILLRQKDVFGPITIHRNQRFEEILAAMNAGAIEASFAEAAPVVNTGEGGRSDAE
ncbi:MAG: segregation and condensation protein A [Terriglobia bacterium]